MRESRSSGSVRGGDGNLPTYSAPEGAGSATRGGRGLGAPTTAGMMPAKLPSERESEHRGTSALGQCTKSLRCGNERRYSINSSARTRIVDGR